MEMQHLGGKHRNPCLSFCPLHASVGGHVDRVAADLDWAEGGGEIAILRHSPIELCCSVTLFAFG